MARSVASTVCICSVKREQRPRFSLYQTWNIRTLPEAPFKTNKQNVSYFPRNWSQTAFLKKRVLQGWLCTLVLVISLCIYFNPPPVPCNTSLHTSFNLQCWKVKWKYAREPPRSLIIRLWGCLRSRSRNNEVAQPLCTALPGSVGAVGTCWYFYRPAARTWFKVPVTVCRWVLAIACLIE